MNKENETFLKAQLGITSATSSNGTIHIEDPTIKVKLPSNLLAALGNTQVNLQIITSQLDDLIETLTGVSKSDNDTPGQPHSALSYAQENAALSWSISDKVKFLAELIGEFKIDSDGQLISMGE